MDTSRPFFGSKINARFIDKFLQPILNNLLLVILFVLLTAFIIEIGFYGQSLDFIQFILNHFHLFFTIIGIIYLVRITMSIGFRSYNVELVIYSLTALIVFSTITFNIDRDLPWLNTYSFYAILVLLIFILEISRFEIKYLSIALNPAQLFMISFGLIISVGSMLLMLPKATTNPIRYIDALFTSTSAVCVTGLTVLDTAEDFTFLGKSIILILIQIGGIGIMTFTSFFGYFFKGSSASFSEKFVLSDFLSEENVSEIAKTISKIVLITLMIESIGATFIYFSLDTSYFQTIEKRIYFSVFHSVSAFCNAGFSTLSSNLYDVSTRNSISMLYSISILIILGGIGFPILLNIYTFTKYKVIALFGFIFHRKRTARIPQLISINTRLVVITTLFLLIVGTVFFFVFERNNTLEGMSLSDKLVHSFLGSVTPRTAGFNSVNYTRISLATAVLTIFLMWVGASPVSSGGGIKTTTFAIAILNTLRIARMKRHIEFHEREIHERSVNRAFSIIILSIIILGCSSLIMYLIEPAQGALRILFECVSAFGTVGLSLGITAWLTDASKILLISLMFIGRMGILTLLFTFIRKQSTSVYRFPKENIIIN